MITVNKKTDGNFFDFSIISGLTKKSGFLCPSFCSCPRSGACLVPQEKQAPDIGHEKKENRLQYAVGGFIANGIITYGIKFATGRTRPDESNRRSFPSGHTSNSFLTATIANEIYGNKVGIPAYTLACITGLSRLHDNKHYASDVIFGAALGTAIGKGFGSIFREINTPKVSINYLKKGFRINIGWTI